MEEEDKKEAIEKTGVDYDKLKEIISTVYPVRYERRTAIAPLLWICGAMFTTSLVWCAVNVCFGNWDEKYIEKIYNFASTIAEASCGIAIVAVVLSLIFAPDRLYSEHYLLEMKKIEKSKEGDVVEEKGQKDEGIPLEEGNNNAKDDDDGK